jgi:hypothetical protein
MYFDVFEHTLVYVPESEFKKAIIFGKNKYRGLSRGARGGRNQAERRRLGERTARAEGCLMTCSAACSL